MSDILKIKSWDELWELIKDFSKDAGIRFVYALVVFIVFYLIIHWTMKKLSRSKMLKKLNRSVSGFVISALKVVLYGLLVIYCGSVLGVPQSAFLSLLASVGVAVGLAMQGSLSNFAGGIMLILFKPFRVGDFIEAQGVSGTVDDISVFYTTLITVDKKKITIPNGQLSNANIINYTTIGIRRIDLTFGVSYASDVDEVKGVLMESANNNPLILADPAPFTGLQSTGDNALIFILWAFCKSPDYLNAMYSLTEDVKANLDKHGVDIPFPQLDVHFDKENENITE